jgi:hypothetical protein
MQIAFSCNARGYSNGTGTTTNCSTDFVNLSITYTTDNTPPTHSLNSTNSTLAGTPILHSLNWTDNIGLNGYIFSFWNGTDLINSTPPSVYNDSAGQKDEYPSNLTIDRSTSTEWISFTSPFWVIYDLGVEALVTGVNVYSTNYSNGFTPCNITVYVSNNPNNWGSSLGECNFSDTTGWHWCDNTDKAGRYIKLTVGTTDINGLNCGSGTWLTEFYEFQFNSTGLYNDTWVAFSGTWSNVTKTVNSTTGALIKWCVYANDTSNNWNGTSCINPFSYTTTDGTPPIITIQSPVNNTVYPNNTIWFNVTLNEAGSVCLVNISNYNNTLTNSTGNWNKLNNTLADGNYKCRFYCNDTLGNMNSSVVVNFTIDTTAPTITVLSPANNTVYPNNTIWFNVTLNEAGSACLVNISNSNNTLTNSTGNWNKLNNTLADGNYWTRFYCNDTSGNMNSSVYINFTIDSIPPTFSNNATNSTLAGYPTNFTITISDIGVSGYIFSTNNSGTWANSSFVSTSGQTVTGWNVTVLNSTVGVLVQWKFYANDTSNNWNVSDTYNLTTTSVGKLIVNLVYPTAGPTTNVDQNTTFNVNATVTCVDNDCGTVYGTVQYNASSDNPDTPINSTQGATPFYNISGAILQSCGSLNKDQSCQLNWTLNATGAPISGYKIGVLFNSSYSSVTQNHTNNATITIIECTESMSIGWSSIYFGYVNPNTAGTEAPGNDNKLYNITNTGTCTLKTWIKGTDLENTTLPYPNIIGTGNLTWSNTTNSSTSSYAMTTFYTLLNSSLTPTIKNITTYYWLSVPPVYAGQYNGTIYICENTTQQSGASNTCT